jgi:hypothetical protein
MRLSGGTDDPFGEFPSRPRFMHRTTYERWRRAHDDAEERSAMGLMNFVERLGRRSRVAGRMYIVPAAAGAVRPLPNRRRWGGS